ncbi:uncharacterized protein [Branchiostoma lanceolatum]|uniref:uncharacterized protein n=1 Tax=Branchiostoma lanceolatum TaxID=7740 RepID=UPI003455E1D1
MPRILGDLSGETVKLVHIFDFSEGCFERFRPVLGSPYAAELEACAGTITASVTCCLYDPDVRLHLVGSDNKGYVLSSEKTDSDQDSLTVQLTDVSGVPSSFRRKATYNTRRWDLLVCALSRGILPPIYPSNNLPLLQVTPTLGGGEGHGIIFTNCFTGKPAHVTTDQWESRLRDSPVLKGMLTLAWTCRERWRVVAENAGGALDATYRDSIEAFCAGQPNLTNVIYYVDVFCEDLQIGLFGPRCQGYIGRVSEGSTLAQQMSRHCSKHEDLLEALLHSLPFYREDGRPNFVVVPVDFALPADAEDARASLCQFAATFTEVGLNLEP